MELARADRRFAYGIAAVLAVWAIYALAVRGPLRAGTRSAERELRAQQPKLERYFRSPKAPELTRVRAELAGRIERLDKRLAALRAAVEFDPGPLDKAGTDGADPRTLYFKLSNALHEKLQAKAQQAAHLVRVPPVFDPQGGIQTPPDAAAVPRLHRQLAMAYRILDAAIDHRVDVLELRAPTPRAEAPSNRAYLDELSVSVRARGALDPVAAWLHALSQPPAGAGVGQFLSVGRLELGPDAGQEAIEYRVTFVSVQANPAASLAGRPAKPDGGPTGRRRPWRAPIY